MGGDYLYVTDTQNNRLKMMDKYTGTVLAIVQLTLPNALAVDHAPPNDLAAIAHVYVVDSSGLVKKFRALLDSTGTYSLSFTNSYNYNPTTGGSPNTLAVYNHQLYVSIYNETASGLIQKRDSSGNLLTSWGQYGGLKGQLKHVRAIAITPAGKIYVANSENRRVDIYSNQPNAPTNLVANLAGYNKINLSWTDNSIDETDFEIERCYATTVDGVSCNNFEHLETIAANSTSYSDTSLPQGNSNYRYRVKAIKAGSSSDPSNIAEIIVQGLAPNNLIATPLGSGRINLQWLDSFSNETGFLVERCETNSCNWQNIATVAAKTGTGTTVILNNNQSINFPLFPATEYTYRVRAYRRINTTTVVYSNYVQTNATTLALPLAPTLNSLVALATNKVSIQLIDNSPDETGFRIERCLSTDCRYAAAGSIAAQTGTGNTVNVTNTISPISPSTTYGYRLRAIRVTTTVINGFTYTATDYSPYSNELPITTLSMVQAPINFSGVGSIVDGLPQVALSWDYTDSPESVRIDRCTLDIATSICSTYGLVVTQVSAFKTYVNNRVARGKTYRYRIKAIRGTESSAYVVSADITVPN